MSYRVHRIRSDRVRKKIAAPYKITWWKLQYFSHIMKNEKDLFLQRIMLGKLRKIQAEKCRKPYWLKNFRGVVGGIFIVFLSISGLKSENRDNYRQFPSMQKNSTYCMTYCWQSFASVNLLISLCFVCVAFQEPRQLNPNHSNRHFQKQRQWNDINYGRNALYLQIFVHEVQTDKNLDPENSSKKIKLFLFNSQKSIYKVASAKEIIFHFK